MATWNNWAETVTYDDLEEEYEPSTREELIQCIKEAVNKGWKLRSVGQGHAWSNLGVPSRCRGAVISMKKLNKPLGIDKATRTVEVQAGISIENLNDWLFQNGLALKNMGDANPQTIVGALSTETHGSGVTLGSLSEFVEGMTLVTADGQVRALEGDELKAGRVSLGKLGAIYSVKLGVTDSYYLHHQQELVELGKEKDQLHELLNKRHLEYWYYPYTGMAERITREILPLPAVFNPLDIFEEWFIQVATEIVDVLGQHHPDRLPQFFKDNVNSKNPMFKAFERKGPSHKILLGKSNVWRKFVKTFTMEYQFPLDKLWDGVKELDDSIALAAKKCVYVAAPVHIRFSKKSTSSFLSHLVHEPTVSFAISFFRKHSGAHTWLPELERRLIALGGKPHWGKIYYTVPEKPAEFEAIRKRLDPNRIFGFEQAPYTPDAEAFQDS